MANIRLQWTGSFDSQGIEGYELGWKHSTSSSYTTVPFISSSSTSGSYIFLSSSFGNTYDFRIRTKNTRGKFAYNYVYTSVLNNSNVPPTAPTILVPTPSVPGVRDLFMAWAGATDDVGIYGYNWRVYQTAGNILIASGTHVTSSANALTQSYGILNVSTTYYAQVQTIDVNFATSSFISASFTSNPAFELYRSVDSQTDFEDVCATEFPTFPVYTEFDHYNLNTGHYVYTTNNFSIAFNGGSNWWRIGVTDGTEIPKSYKIESDGLITGISDCPTFVFTFARSNFSYDPLFSTLTDACNDFGLDFEDIYSPIPIDNLNIGSHLFTDNTLSTPWNGGGNYWKLGASFSASSAIAIQVSSTGEILDGISCS